MKTVFAKNEDLIRAYFGRHVPYGRTSTGNLSFNSEGILYSYSMPIAWRNKQNCIVVRSYDDSPSVTTTHHMSLVRAGTRVWPTAEGVNLEMLEKFGIEIDDIKGRNPNQYEAPGVSSALLFKKGDKDYRLLKAVTLARFSAEAPLFTRNVSDAYWVTDADKDAPAALDLLPVEHRAAARDGWVGYTGHYFLRAYPEFHTRDLPGSTEKNALIGKNFTVTEKRGDYIRGVLRDLHGNFIYSTKSDGRASMPLIWHRVIEPRVKPVPQNFSGDVIDYYVPWEKFKDEN